MEFIKILRLPEWMIPTLPNNFRNLFQENGKNSKLSILNEYQIQPIRKDKNLYNGTSGEVTNKLRKIFKSDQLLLKPIIQGVIQEQTLANNSSGETTTTTTTTCTGGGNVGTNKTLTRPVFPPDPRIYHFANSKEPKPLIELLTYFYWIVRIPPDTPVKVTVGLFGREGRMTIKPMSPLNKKSDKNDDSNEKNTSNDVTFSSEHKVKRSVNPSEQGTSCRVVVHFGPDEVYRLTEVTSSGKLGLSKQIILTNGSYLIINSEESNRRNVYVSPNPKVKFPLPDNCDEMIQDGLSAVGSAKKFGKGARMPDEDQVKMMMKKSGFGKTKIRLREYRRLTIVLDFGSSIYAENEKIAKIAGLSRDPLSSDTDQDNINNNQGRGNDEGCNIDLPNKLPTHIPEGIAKSLPPGLDPSIISKVARNQKLSGLVNEIARGVASDLKEREEFKDSQPKVTSGLIGAIAQSAVTRIDRNKVMKAGRDLDSLVPRGEQDKLANNFNKILDPEKTLLNNGPSGPVNTKGDQKDKPSEGEQPTKISRKARRRRRRKQRRATFLKIEKDSTDFLSENLEDSTEVNND